MRARTFAVLLALAVTGLGLLAWSVVATPGPSDRQTPDGSAAETTAADTLCDPAGHPLRRADGTPFPAGSRREGRSVVTPDGRVWRHVDGAWVTAEGATGHDTGGGRRHVDVATARAAGQTVAPPPPLEIVPPATPPRPRNGTAIPATNVRPAELTALSATTTTTAATPTAPPPPPQDWTPPDATIAPSGGTRPRLDVFRDPEAAQGRVRDRVDDDRAAAETAAVIAQHGLRGDYYDVLTGDIRDVPDVSALTPSFSRIDLAIDFATDEAFALPFEPETFAVRWTGWIHTPATGEYTFTCGSDDGARLVLDGQEVFAYRALRPYAETAGSVTLDAGRHAVEMVFYENRVYASCRLYWSGPGFENRVVETAALSPPDTLAGVLQPHIARIEPASARVGEQVTISGIGFSPLVEAHRVTFAGVPAQVLGTTDGALTVQVPLGAQTGDVTVQVGELTSLPRPFAVDSLNGLFAEYFLIGQDLAVMPDLDTLTPYFVRLDGPLDYHQDLLWELPYEPDVFAARYRGFLYVPVDDDYRISLGSDDGAQMTIDGVRYLDAPGLHPYREVTRTTRFTQGFHPIEITFFENRGVARLRLFWQRPHEPERHPVPRGFLFPPEALASAVAPIVAPVAPAGIGETISIAGTGFGNDASLVRVRFAGDAWARPVAVTPNLVTAVVPRTAASGPLRVDVGVLSSNAVPFTRTTPVGLTADIYVFAGTDELRAAVAPEAYAERSPHLTRVETGWRRDAATAWDLPFPVQNLAVHWHGTLAVDTATDIGWVLQADDGALLYVDGTRVLDNAPFHALQERFGRSVLQPGDHRFDLWYFQAAGDARLHLFWNPWGLQDHRDVPTSWFRPD